MKIAVCDDEKNIRKLLISLIQKMADDVQVEDFEDGEVFRLLFLRQDIRNIWRKPLIYMLLDIS